MKYLHRTSDDLLDKVFSDVSAIAIERARTVSRTKTARHHMWHVPEFDDSHALSALRTDTDALLGIDEAILIDE